jgi:hypothetical protein
MTTAELKFQTLEIDEKSDEQTAEETINALIVKEQKAARQNQFKQQQHNNRNTNQPEHWQPNGVTAKQPSPKLQETDDKIAKENEKQQTRDDSHDTHAGKQDEKQELKHAGKQDEKHELKQNEETINANNSVTKEPVKI